MSKSTDSRSTTATASGAAETAVRPRRLSRKLGSVGLPSADARLAMTRPDSSAVRQALAARAPVDYGFGDEHLDLGQLRRSILT